MKKTFAFFAAALMLLASLTGCGASVQNQDKLSVITTIFPEYDWVCNIAGDVDNVDITMLLDNGVDLHSYQPSAADLIKISQCDVFIYVGGESDEWVEDALEEASNKDMVVVNLMETLGSAVKQEELVEGMQGEDEDDDDDDGEETEYDEHVWLSLKNAKVLVNAISQALAKADAQNAQTYAANADAYISKLSELDEKYSAAVSAAAVKTLLFGDRFPFRYLVDDYGLDYYAAFVGCSAESEASFETVTFLANKVKDLSLSTVLTLEGSDNKIAETIISASGVQGVQILSMDSMQSTTAKDVKEGANYISIMENNLQVLTQALQ